MEGRSETVTTTSASSTRFYPFAIPLTNSLANPRTINRIIALADSPFFHDTTWLSISPIVNTFEHQLSVIPYIPLQHIPTALGKSKPGSDVGGLAFGALIDKRTPTFSLN